MALLTIYLPDYMATMTLCLPEYIVCLPEYMADPTAGHNLDAAAAHPGLEAELELLAAPDLHALVVETKLGWERGRKLFMSLLLFRMSFLNVPLS